MVYYDKDNLYKEFDIAKKKDFELAKNQFEATNKKYSQDDIETSVYTNRIKFFKEHIINKSKNPKVYENLDINFDELLKTYETESPRDTFYLNVFNKTYLQKKLEEEAELEAEYGKK